MKHQHGSQMELHKIRLEKGIRMIRHTAPISKKLKMVQRGAKQGKTELKHSFTREKTRKAL